MWPQNIGNNEWGYNAEPLHDYRSFKRMQRTGLLRSQDANLKGFIPLVG
jgi:hypothetical protein